MSRRSQRKPTNIRATMGKRGFLLDPEEENWLCQHTRAKRGATVVPHSKWKHGEWLRDPMRPEQGTVRPPQMGDVWLVNMNIINGGHVLVAYPISLLREGTG